jgi:hypothetical protein
MLESGMDLSAWRKRRVSVLFGTELVLLLLVIIALLSPLITDFRPIAYPCE